MHRRYEYWLKNMNLTETYAKCKIISQYAILLFGAKKLLIELKIMMNMYVLYFLVVSYFLKEESYTREKQEEKKLI